MDDVLAIILGGGQGSRLFPLTQQRSKPAVPIGGKYRLIDVPMSNCLHAGVQHVDGDGYYIRSGIIIVPKGGRIAAGTVV